MKTTDPIDAARIELLLSELRLPAIKAMWAKFAEQSDKEGWPAVRLLAAFAEQAVWVHREGFAGQAFKHEVDLRLGLQCAIAR